MALTENREVDHYVDQELRSYRVAAGVKIFKGALVVIEKTTGYAKPFERSVYGGRRNLFVGIAIDEVDNSVGKDGDDSVRVITVGDFAFVIGGADMCSIGCKVYASSDCELTMHSGNRWNNVYVGRIQDWIQGHEFIVRLHGVADADVN